MCWDPSRRASCRPRIGGLARAIFAIPAIVGQSSFANLQIADPVCYGGRPRVQWAWSVVRIRWGGAPPVGFQSLFMQETAWGSANSRLRCGLSFERASWTSQLLGSSLRELAWWNRKAHAWVSGEPGLEDQKTAGLVAYLPLRALYVGVPSIDLDGVPPSSEVFLLILWRWDNF